MKTITRKIVCPSCSGYGFLSHVGHCVTGATTRVCPACGGNKTVIETVTED